MPDVIAANPGKPYALTELIVGLSRDGLPGAAAEALARAGATVPQRITPPGLAGADIPEVVRVSLAPGRSIEQAIAALEHRPGIAFVEPNWQVSVSVVPNDAFYVSGQLWGMSGDEVSPTNP